MIKRLIALAISLISLAGCSSSSNESVTNVDIEAFLSQISSGEVIVLDVRTPEEFNAGHLSGAVNLDVQSGQFETELSKLDKAATYAIYCRSGRRSTIAAEKMANAGFANIINFNQGGFAELAQAGAQTE